MPWFKVDDGFWSHPKVIELSPEAGWLWTRAGSYSAKHLTDGKITSGTLRMLAADMDAATELVMAGLWDFDEDGRFWRFHDWHEYQPTREQVEDERRKAAERMRAVRANRSRTNDDGSPSPSRPVPTRPDSSTYVPESPHVGNREDEIDAVDNPLVRSLTGLGISAAKVQAHIAQHVARDVSAATACDVSLHILAKRSEMPKHPQAYVLGAITKSPFEIQQYIDTKAA